MYKRILVTGGAGFIGSSIVDLLIANGYGVIVLDNLSAGKRENINKKAKFIFGDVLDIEKFHSKLRNVDAVLHCAAQISVAYSLRNPAEDATTNVIGALRVLEMCRKHGIKKFVFSSTGGAMYGHLPKSRLPASEKIIEVPESPYGIAKRGVEMYMNFYSKVYGLDCVSLRYSNVYGPRQDCLGEAGVIAIFLNKLLRGERPVIFGDGSQTRDFVYVHDVAEANMKALAMRVNAGRINIGTSAQTSINSLLSKIRKILGKESIRPIYGKERKNEIRFSSLGIRLAKKELKWSPKVRLEDGLRKTADWFQKK